MLVFAKDGLYFWVDRSAYRCDVDCFTKNLLNKLGSKHKNTCLEIVDLMNI